MTPHRLAIRVYYEDTDFSGVVYHASYLRFFERGRTELLRDLGIRQSALFAAGVPLAFAVARIEVDFRKPALMDDLVTVETAVEAVRGASLLMRQRLLRGEEVLTLASVRIAALGNGRPTRLPADLAARLAAEALPAGSTAPLTGP